MRQRSRDTVYTYRLTDIQREEERESQEESKIRRRETHSGDA